MPDCTGLSCWFKSAVHRDSTPVEVPLMLDDSVGSLTRSVYDSSAQTLRSFSKLVPKLVDLDSKSAKFASDLRSHSANVEAEILRSSLSAKTALSVSKQITNGSSDASSTRLIHGIIHKLESLLKHLVGSLRAQNAMADSIQSDSQTITSLGRDILGSTQKSFSVLSVSDKICSNAKILQNLSKSVIDKAERHHLVEAAPFIHNGVAAVKKIVDAERQFLPLKLPPLGKLVSFKFAPELQRAYSHTNDALAHAHKALMFSGAARAREIVDMRDELRNVLDHTQNATMVKHETTDSEIAHKIVPSAHRVSEIIKNQLLPQISQFGKINSKILKAIDQNQSITIDERITKKMTKQSQTPIFLLRVDNRDQKWKNFL